MQLSDQCFDLCRQALFLGRPGVDTVDRRSGLHPRHSHAQTPRQHCRRDPDLLARCSLHFENQLVGSFLGGPRGLQQTRTSSATTESKAVLTSSGGLGGR